MRLTHFARLPSSRLPGLRLFGVVAVAVLTLAVLTPPGLAPAQTPPPAKPAPVATVAPPSPAGSRTAPAAASAQPEDILGTLVVTPGAGRPLPKIGIVRSLSADLSDVLLHTLVARDLDLCGEVEILPESAANDDTLSDSTVDVDAWAKRGASAVVKVTGRTTGDKVSAEVQAYFVKSGPTPVFDRTAATTPALLRDEAHRLSDLLIGALTGQNGGFYSHMTFTATTGLLHTAYVVDADGHDVRSISGVDELAIFSTFGKGEQVYWGASVDDEPYAIRTSAGVVPTSVSGSVYGLAFSRDRSQVAASIGTDDGIAVFTGKDLTSLTRASTASTAIDPAFTPSGKVVYAAAGRFGQRIFVDGKAVSPEGLFASSPTVCNHPDGVRIVFAAGSGARTDLLSMNETGGGLVRLTAGTGSNGAPACSPDGRLVAFFSTRTSGEGPGLYLMRLDGRRPKRISPFVGDTLHWDPRPAPPAAAPVSSGVPATAGESTSPDRNASAGATTSPAVPPKAP